MGQVEACLTEARRLHKSKSVSAYSALVANTDLAQNQTTFNKYQKGRKPAGSLLLLISLSYVRPIHYHQL